MDVVPQAKKLRHTLKMPFPEVIDPKGRFFTSIGDPVVWYYRTKDGNFEFYDVPGFRPRSGEQLQPITKAVVDEWERLLHADGATVRVLVTGERVGPEGDTTRADLEEWSKLVDVGVVGLGN